MKRGQDSPHIAVNLILFEPAEIGVPLARDDRRAIHLLDVLRRIEGDTFDGGIINGPRGKGTLINISSSSLSLEFSWSEEISGSDPLTLLIGLPRPQTARAILREATSLGVAALHFVTTDKGDPNYANSTLWQSGEWRRHLLLGAEQAFCTRIPDVSFGKSVTDAITALPVQKMTRIALDNYESPTLLSQLTPTEPVVALAVGPERGWSARERDTLRQHGFTLAHLGKRVLRTETACIGATILLKAKMGWL
jgi:16S rRNA (uracil1498-N3)-methyltransferase